MLNMPRILLISLLTFCAFSTQAKPDIEQFFTSEAKIYNAETCFRKPFDSYRGWMAMMQQSMKRRSQDELALNRRLERFKSMFPLSSFEKYLSNLDCITFEYKVDNEVVSGYLVRPKGNDPLPIIVYNRGGNGDFGAMVFGAIMNQIMPLSEQGFIVIGSQYRGTFQEGGLFKDEFGGADVEDVVSLVNRLQYLKHAKHDSIGMFGSSRGGMQSLLALKQLDNTVKTAVLLAGNYDLKRDLTIRPTMETIYEKRIPNYATEKDAQLRKRSALYWSHEINPELPILLQHGDQDKRVNVYNSKALAKQFKATNRPHILSIYEGDDHGLSNNQDEAFSERVMWFTEHLIQN